MNTCRARNSLPTDTRALHELLACTARTFFFTGKGGVGKTSIAAATAVALADSGKRVLLISTDPASNLDEVLGLELSRHPRPVVGCPNLSALNIDPEAVAAAYREKVLAPMRGVLPESALQAIEEQLSGACTMEIAAFDEFTAYLTDDQSEAEILVFDTAPTGHTLRLMALSQAWTQYLDRNTSGNSCLGPLAGLEKQREIYARSVEILKNPAHTAVFLVSRPNRSPLKEAQRTWKELCELGINNQSLILNGWLDSADDDDSVAHHWLERQNRAVAEFASFLQSLPLYLSPLQPSNLIGLDILRGFYEGDLSNQVGRIDNAADTSITKLPTLAKLADELARAGRGVILTMGKGGVGKTTVAAALSLALADRGASVRLSTTDPASHLQDALENFLEHPSLHIEKIDPKVETEAYVKEILENQGAGMDAEQLALLEEDLRSPCTEEIAVFRAFARTIARGEDQFVVLDTAPTGHTLLLLDATQSYHRELERQSRNNQSISEIELLLPRLRDADFTKVLIITLPESTPVHEASALQNDLRRAGIEPYAWVINQSLALVETTSPVLAARRRAELPYIREVIHECAKKAPFLVAWSSTEPTGSRALQALLT